MTDLLMGFDCPIGGCDGTMLVPASAMHAVWPDRSGLINVELKPDEVELKELLHDHIADQHPDVMVRMSTSDPKAVGGDE